MMNLSTKQYKLLIMFFSIPLVLYMAYGYANAFTTYFCDGFLRWQEGACILHGVYPMDIILGRIPSIPEFGVFDNTTTTVPWSYFLANIFYPGVFPTWNSAKIWCLALFTVLGVTCALILYKTFLNARLSKLLSVFLCIQFFVHFGWGSSLNKLNNGMFCILALLMVLLLLEYQPHNTKNEMEIGFLMVIAMLKPQVAMLFYIPLLFRKYYKSIFLSGCILLISWLGVSAMVHVSPLTILIEQFQVGADLKQTSVYVYYGIFDFLTRFGFSTAFIMLLEAAVFIPLTFMLCYRYRNCSAWVSFSIPALFMLFWCYHHNTDIEIVGILMICIAFLLLSDSHLKKGEQVYCIFLLLFNLCPIIYTYYEISPSIPFLQRIFYLVGLFIILKHADFFTALSNKTP